MLISSWFWCLVLDHLSNQSAEAVQEEYSIYRRLLLPHIQSGVHCQWQWHGALLGLSHILGRVSCLCGSHSSLCIAAFWWNLVWCLCGCQSYPLLLCHLLAGLALWRVQEKWRQMPDAFCDPTAQQQGWVLPVSQPMKAVLFQLQLEIQQGSASPGELYILSRQVAVGDERGYKYGLDIALSLYPRCGWDEGYRTNCNEIIVFASSELPQESWLVQLPELWFLGCVRHS